ncbi:CoA pyrophosphatase [Salinibacterium sp. dk2585]|uniref:NUDIX hydrolase n=1 Tax=unclassified Salinibacterium TaxID=2632331 RepID=UPI0011C24B59|nr:MULTISPECIES: CoA pyrophosphatase [unclassified Salinibacterium]QEE61057.1 CoA pyrophosphatase [Salinibacterium sp. dk2585]TXK52999.1 CoA pyrophosphatase [Salinibacterium sp. dk5596]
MPEMDDARAQLRRLCDGGFKWRMDASRFDFDRSRARRSGVLVLFGRLDAVPASATGTVAGDLDVLLQRRAATMGHHPGQISFPGGGVEQQDADVTATALREAVEETGLDPAGVEILGTLPELPLAVSHNLVTPVPAWWTRPSDVAAIDHREAVDVFRMPVADLLDPENRRSVVHRIEGRSFTTPAFQVGERLVWGFTAIVLSNMFDALGWGVPWDESRTVTP